jgi:hypothetical protein
MAAIDSEHFIDGLPQHLGDPERALEVAELQAATESSTPTRS